MSLQLFDRDGVLGSQLTPEEIAKGVKLEEHTEVVNRYLEGVDGTYGFQGLLPRGGEITVPKATMKDGISHAERIERVKERMAKGEPPLLVAYDPETETPLFAEQDKEAYEAGYICPGCFQWQGVPNAPECNWLRPDITSNMDPRDLGCGHRNH